MPPSADNRTVRLEVPARPDYVLLGRLALSAVCRLTPLEAPDVADLKLAVTEAATAFVGDGDALTAGGDERASSELSAHDGERLVPRLSFEFELDEDRLAVEIGCPGGIVLSDEERELGRAIIEVTVDECEYSEGTMRLVKYLGSAG